ncbi:MAG: hypothetical protein COY42_28775 [Armatimonadetes bacterium CG_4_10_14_0_8_um_filter_66_14]|nr:hypothetical protein [Armatimonadota bacterium]OIO92632.1 MAG: hypothetical protein AUJ96_31930 [Armatimonadetes bacterium CG2_30_66_41]PIU92689.1 MAG: hypothetical protein COS65_16590 [Armatimonadetes bacterium CG06_land_8_20_14_3_00_66_21]PIZ34376.1 MAG: hypothetical protein COY42_28775 [Armatimonadetes bacterium CG_4_10_14_0_8_um_filter_66_14]PJB69638.1 MAG: hypothetical protein CO096_12725 [Armatimonadetes bacterium CG_4_9_14_3_um_filter_66_14]
MRYLMTMCATVGILASACAQEPPAQVLVTDHGAQTSVAGPGAPAHIVGLQRTMHTVSMDTGVKDYGLRYVIAHDDKRPGVAIPGEGYIGMPQPADCNWYGGGFFDLQLNGQTIGTTPLHSLVGRGGGNRGYVDFTFDTPLSVIRIRFVTLAGNDALYCQALLEPKAEITSVRVAVRCYPSAFVNNSDRHVLTPVRKVAQGEHAELDPSKEWWLLYYDRLFDAGQVSPSRTGVGPCSVLWPGAQADKVSFTVGGYGIDTTMDLKPQSRDFRFVFFDYSGTKNAVATAALRQRAEGLLRELTALSFADPSTANWPLAQKQQQVAALLATMPDEQEAATRYQKWAAELAEQLKLVHPGAVGAVMAEAAAGEIIRQWEQGLPELRLRALLKEI